METLQYYLNPAQEYCTNILTKGNCVSLPFHNLEHTKEVVQNVTFLCDAMNINKQDTEILQVAAWFHDTGFSKTYKGHEEESKKIATTFLIERKVNKGFIDKVCSCIDATKMPQCPTTALAAKFGNSIPLTSDESDPVVPVQTEHSVPA